MSDLNQEIEAYMAARVIPRETCCDRLNLAVVELSRMAQQLRRWAIDIQTDSWLVASDAMRRKADEIDAIVQRIKI